MKKHCESQINKDLHLGEVKGGKITIKDLIGIELSYQLRGIAMIMIILHHVSQTMVSLYSVSIPHILAYLLQQSGFLFCAVFFMLSGYGLCFSIENNSPISVNYCFTHIASLLYPFIFSLILSVLFYYLTGCNINHYWFFDVIFILYVLVILLSKFVSLKSVIFIIAYISLIYICFAGLFMEKMWYNSLFSFSLGMIICHNKDMELRINLNILLLPLFLIVLFMICIPNGIIQNVTGACFSIFLIIMISNFSHPSSILRWIGKNSLILYLVHVSLLKPIASICCSFTIFLPSFLISTIVVSFVFLILEYYFKKYYGYIYLHKNN